MTAPTTSLQQATEQHRIAQANERECAIQNPEPVRPVLPQEITSRLERGYQLWLTGRARITHVEGDTYVVPSCTGSGFYTVHYSGEVEDCTCTDYQVHRGEVACKHLVAVALIHACRRVRTPCGCLHGYHHIGHLVIG